MGANLSEHKRDARSHYDGFCREFAKALGKALHRPAVLPTPPLALRTLLGEVTQIVTTGQRVLPKKALALGYAFR